MSGYSQDSPHAALASADLTAKQYFFVVIDSAGKIAVAGANAVPDGVLQDAPASGKTGTYDAPRGQHLTVIAGEAIVTGEFVSVDSAGKANDADTATDIKVGKCIIGGALDDEIVIQFTGFQGEVA